jgi:hypothetical protein
MSKKKPPYVLAVLITAMLSITLTAFVDQKRWEAREKQQQEEAQRQAVQAESQLRAMGINPPMGVKPLNSAFGSGLVRRVPKLNSIVQ